MKIKELKHNHSLTDLLKVLLFSILMLAPILAIGVKCGYVIINKNAKDSYNGIVSYQQNIPVEKPTDLLQGKTYNIVVLNNVASISNNASYKIGFSEFTLKDYLVNNGQTTISTASYFTIGGAVGYTLNSCFAWYDSNLNYLGRNELPLSNDIVNNLSFVFTQLNTDSPAYFNDTFKDVIKVSNNVLVYNDTLDNVFYYAIDQVAQEPLFNWTQNTAIYTGVNAMCTGMEITSPIIPILITYWFLLTCIYVIIDILIKGFTMLTHLIGSRIAE